MNAPDGIAAGAVCGAQPGREAGLYLDNAATSFPKPRGVVEAVSEFLTRVGASPGRGGYRAALEAERRVFQARRAVARLFNVADPTRIVFTASATEALNLAIMGLIGPGARVVTSSLEHNAVWRPLAAARRAGAEVAVLPRPAGGGVDLEAAAEALRPVTTLLVVAHASNVTGELLPVAALGRLARERGVTFLVDAAQTAGAVPIDVEAMGVDMLAFSGHKGLLGPPGTGGLCIREGVSPRPLKLGGTGSESALEDQPQSLPDRYEAGTLNAPGLAGLAAGVEYVERRGVEAIGAHERALARRVEEGLAALDGVEVYGPGDWSRRVGVVSFNLPGVGCQEVAFALDEMYGFMVRAGLHCAPCAHRALGTLERGSVRVSPGPFTRVEDVESFLEAVRELWLKAGGRDGG